MTKNSNLLAQLTIALVVIGLAAMFFGSFSYRLSNPSLVKRIGNQQPKNSDFGNQGGMGTGMTQEMMGHIGELMGKLAEDPNNFEVRRELAEHFMDVSDWSSAIVHLKRALEINPNDVAANYFMGVSQYNLGNFPESATAFEHLLTVEQDPAAMYNLSVIYAQHLNRLDEAKELLRKVSEMDTASPEMKKNVKEILESLK